MHESSIEDLQASYCHICMVKAPIECIGKRNTINDVLELTSQSDLSDYEAVETLLVHV